MKLLIDLQACDTKMGDLKNKIAEGPLKIKKLEDKLAGIEKEWEETENQLDALKRDRREIEGDIETKESQIGKANTKLSNIKSNKEYRAALKEIEDLSSEKSRLEDKAIEIMEQIDSLSEQCRAKKEEKDHLEQEFVKGKEDILQEMSAMDKDLQALSEKREQFCKRVNEDLLKRYDLIRERKAGLALSPVLDGVCQACHMEIPPQKFNELIRGESLLICPNCHRIIYWGDNEQFQKADEEA